MDTDTLARKLLLSLIFVLLPCCLIARIFETEQTADQTIIETIAKQYPLVKNNAELKILLQNSLGEWRVENSKSAEIITHVFSANKNAAELDRLNSTSTDLFKKALLKARELNRSDLEIWVSIQYGFYLYTYRKYEASFPLFMYCIKTLDQTAAEQVILPGETYKKIAYFLNSVGDYEKSDEYLQLAGKYAGANRSEQASIIDALGQNSVKRNDLVKAEEYFKKAFALAKASKDEMRYAKVLGNLAEVKFKQGHHDIAINLLNQDITISKQLSNTQNTIYALVLLGKVYLAKGNVGEARSQLQLAQQYAQSKTYFKSSDYEINLLILEIARHTGNDKDELSARRNLEDLKSQLKGMDGREVIMKMGWETEKNKLGLKITAEKNRRQRESYLKIAALAGCVMLLITIGFLIKVYRNKIKVEKTEHEKKVLSLTLEKVNSEQKLNANHQTLESYKAYLKEKHSQIEELEFEINKAKQSSSAHLETYSINMQNLLDSHLMSNASWIDFKRFFIQTYPDYYQFLLQNFTGLTDSHLRIIFLTKLEMDNSETARILGLTVEAVKKAKQRLRKKYGKEYDSLFIQNEMV
jgi:tetratricopeptide (TPR) repeat protein